jgi:hypothetical protein
LISYRILSRYPFEIQECSIGTGAACGAVFLDQAFETVLKEKLGRHVDLVWTRRRATDTAKYFDSGIKRQFNPLDRDCETDFEIPFTGAPDVPEVGLESGYMMLQRLLIQYQTNSRDDIQKVFLPIFEKILDLIERQIADVKARNNAPIKVPL